MRSYVFDRIKKNILEAWKTNKVNGDGQPIFVVVRRWNLYTPYVVHEFNEVDATYHGSYVKNYDEVREILEKYGATERIDLFDFVKKYIDEKSE